MRYYLSLWQALSEQQVSLDRLTTVPQGVADGVASPKLSLPVLRRFLINLSVNKAKKSSDL